MDKKKKILIGAVLTVVILLAGVMAGFLFANAEKKESSPQNVENGALTNNERPVYDEKESTESPKNQEAQAQFTPGNAWESDGRKYIQYELNIFSTGKKNIESWKITFPAGSGTVMEQSWNCGVESSTAEDGTVSFTLSPVDYNREIPAGEHTQGIGFIIAGLAPWFSGVLRSISGNYLMDWAFHALCVVGLMIITLRFAPVRFPQLWVKEA